MVPERNSVRGEFSNDEPLCGSPIATYQTSVAVFNQAIISKELKDQHNKQGHALCKPEQFVDRQEILTGTFQEKEKENVERSVDNKNMENLRSLQSLIKERGLSHGSEILEGLAKERPHITNLTDIPTMNYYGTHVKLDKSKEIDEELQKQVDYYVPEKLDKIKYELQTEDLNDKPVDWEHQLDDENAKLARAKIHLLDQTRDVIKLKDVIVEQRIDDIVHVKNQIREIMDNKLKEEMEQRYNESYCQEETSPKIEIFAQQEGCQQKVDLPEKDENQEKEPEFRSLEEGEWFQSIQENSCDCPGSVEFSDLSENGFESREVKDATQVTEDNSKMSLKPIFEDKGLISRMISVLKLLKSEMSGKELKNICGGTMADEFLAVQKNCNVESLLAWMFMKLFFPFEHHQPEKYEAENMTSEKEEGNDVKADNDNCLDTDKNEIEIDKSEDNVLNNKEMVKTEEEYIEMSEKGDIEESEKCLNKYIVENVGKHLDRNKTLCENDVESMIDGYGEEMVEYSDMALVANSCKEPDKVGINQDANDEVKDASTDIKIEKAELIPDIEDPIIQNDTTNNMKIWSNEHISKVTLSVVSLSNKVEDQVKKTKGKRRKCKNQREYTKPCDIEVLKFEHKLKEMTRDMEGLLQESRSWLKKCSRYCLQTCRRQGQNNQKKPYRYEPRTKSNNCDIFIPKTMKDGRRVRLIQCGQTGRRCSDSGSTSDGSLNTGQGDQDQSYRRDKDNEDHNNNHSDENRQNDRGNPNDNNDPGSNKLPGTSLQDATVPQRDFKAYRKKHSDISDEHWEKFLGFIKEQVERRGIPLWDLHPNPVGPCLALCMKLTDDLPDDMLECIVCLSINSLLKHYANCSSTYMNCDLCTQIFSLICCHVNECVQRAETFGNDDDLYASLHVKLCRIALCKRIRQALNNTEISHHLKMLWFNVRKKLSRVIGGTELEMEETPNRRSSIFGNPPLLESIPEGSVPTVTPTSRPGSMILKRKTSNLTKVAETEESYTSPSDGTRSSNAHGELDQVSPNSSVISADAVPEPKEHLPKDTSRFSSLPIGPPKVSDLQFPSFTDRPTGIKGIGEVVYGSKNQLKIVAKSWDKRKNDYQEEGKLPTHYREEGVILDKYMNKLTIQGVRYQKEFQWVRVSALGNGMSGKCSLATDFETDAKFCVKEIHIASYEMEEVILWTDLDHPYIVQLYGAIRFGERVFIFMEYVAGGCLTEAINHQRELGQRLSQATALRYFQQILEVLVHLKAKHILHEDLKGDNILLHKEGTNVSIKVTDFGAARRCEDKVRKGTKPIGTQTQWSPEKAEATGYSYPAELWAAVCVLVHMLSGTPPWIRRFESFKTLIVVIVDHSPPLEDVPRNISKSVQDLIERGFTVCPGTRPTAEELLRHSAFSILDNSPTSEAYSILAPGFLSVPCIEDDLTKDLREIYKQLGSTSPDKKTFPFLQPSTTVQVYTMGVSLEQETNNVHNVGGARSVGGGATGEGGGVRRREGRVEDTGIIDHIQQTAIRQVNASVHREGGAQNYADKDFELRGIDERAENRQGSGNNDTLARNISTPSDPNKNLDPTEHFNNFLNDTTPPGMRPPETADNVIEYNPETADTGVDQETDKSNDSSLRISSDDIIKKIVPNFDLLLDPEEKSDNYGDEGDSQADEEEEDMFKDFDLNVALKRMNLSSDRLGEEMQDTERKDDNDDDDDDDDKKKLSEAAVEPVPTKPVVHLPIKPVVHHEQEAFNSIDGDDLFKSGSPTSAGYIDFNVNSQIYPQPPVAGNLNNVQGPERFQHARPYGQYGPGHQNFTSPQYQLHQQGDQQYRNPYSQPPRQYWEGPISVQVPGTNYGLSDQISPRHSTANPYNRSDPEMPNMRADPLSLSPIQNTRHPQSRNQQGYSHSLSPSQFQQNQSRQFEHYGHGNQHNQTIYQRRQLGTQQWVDPRRFQQYITPNQNYMYYPQHYDVTGQMNTSHATVPSPQMSVQPVAPTRFGQQTNGIAYQIQNPNTRTQYIPVERIITEPPNQNATRQSTLQLDVEKARYGLSQPPSTYAQTAPVESPPKMSPTYKRTKSYIPSTQHQAPLSTASASSTNKTSKSQYEEQERAFLELEHTARKELSQHDGSIPDFHDEDDFGVEGEIDVTGNLTSQEWESMAAYLQEEEKNSRIEVTFKKRGEEENVMKMKFARKSRTATWESIIDDDLSRVFHELSSEYQRFCLRQEDGTLLDINGHLGDNDVVLFIEPAEDDDWWCVEKGMIMKS